MNWLKRLFKKVELPSVEKDMRVRGKWPSDTITKSEVKALGYEIKQAWVKEWVSALQIGCPYCEEIQTESTAIDVVHSPPDYWGCATCGKLIGLMEGRSSEKVKKEAKDG